METKPKKPPKLAEWILKKTLPGFLDISALGDYEEIYNRILKKYDKKSAIRWYWQYCLKSFPYFLKDSLYWRSTMFKNYLITAFRAMKRQKVYTFINISGLALGMAACILLLLWVQDELSFDNFHAHKDKIYRIISEQNSPEKIHKTVLTPGALGAALKSEYPEILDFSRLRINTVGTPLTYKEKVFTDEIGAQVDPSFFAIFSFEFVQGDPKTAVLEPDSLVITEELSQKCFGDENPIGKILQLETFDYKVMGVIENIPRNSHIQFDFIHKLDSGNEGWEAAINVQTYILSADSIDQEALAAKIKDVVNDNTEVDNVRLSLQPLDEIHLFSSSLEDDSTNYKKGDIVYIYFFSITAFCVLLIACINFTNLSSACYSKRVKEIGLRRVVGAHRSDIVRQFFGESILLSYLAFFLAVLLADLFLPVFNNLFSKQLSIGLLTNAEILPGLILIPLLTGLASGIYPVIFFSSFQPAKVIKNFSLFKAKSNLALRKILIVIQFAFAIILIIGSITIYRQLSFMRNKDLGFNKDNIITLFMRSLEYEYENTIPVKNELLKNPNIVSVSASLPPIYGQGSSNVHWEGKNQGDQIIFYAFFVDYDYLNTVGMKMAEGRFFAEEFSTDTQNYVINETAARAMGPSSPVGKRFRWNDLEEGTIIGVVKDYHQESLHHQIKPSVLIRQYGYWPEFCIKIGPKNMNETLNYIGSVWKKFEGESVPFTYKFLDETLDNMYKSEKRTGSIIKFFTSLTIFISCLGLFGLASITAIQRKKEIAIRKLLGASMAGINLVLSKEFVKWVVISNVLAWPVAWIVMNKWLENFAYKTSINIATFILAGTISLGISLFSVIFQTFKATAANPADSLRNE